MLVSEAIAEFDSLKPNSYGFEQKVVWLGRLDSFIRSTILSRFKDAKVDLLGLEDPGRKLLMEEPFSEGYLYWLSSRVHYFNEETDRYNSAVRMFRSIFEDYQRSLSQKYMPENPGVFRF